MRRTFLLFCREEEENFLLNLPDLIEDKKEDSQKKRALAKQSHFIINKEQKA